MLRLWHRQALHFTSSLQQHVQGQLLGICWQRLVEGLSAKPVDIIEIAAQHSAYLEDALDSCFLPSKSNSSDPAWIEAVTTAFRACEVFAVLCGSFASYSPVLSSIGCNGGSRLWDLLELSHKNVDKALYRAHLAQMKSSSTAMSDLDIGCRYARQQ